MCFIAGFTDPLGCICLSLNRHNSLVAGISFTPIKIIFYERDQVKELKVPKCLYTQINALERPITIIVLQTP